MFINAKSTPPKLTKADQEFLQIGANLIATYKHIENMVGGKAPKNSPVGRIQKHLERAIEEIRVTLAHNIQKRENSKNK